MDRNKIDAGILQKCFIAGAKNLEANKEYINELNVFPVPDGDTGTNMTMTILSAARAVAELDEVTMESVCKAIAGGSLRGARGNSGVILSQLLRGFCKVVREEKEIDSIVLAQAFRRAAETAYKAVMKPKEGTILTVAKGMADRIEALAPEAEDVTALLEETITYGDEVLAKTPEQLPVLKEAGVVDSGGQGLMTALKGALAFLQGKEVDLNLDAPAQGAASSASAASGAAALGERRAISTDDIKFGYCTEFIVNLKAPLTETQLSEFKAFLTSIGDSIVCVADDDIVKVHVHTNHPGQAFEKGLTLGSLSRMKVDNMREEHEEKLIKDASKIAAMEKLRENDALAAEEAEQKPVHKENAFVTVCAGSGLAEIFKGLGADEVIEGGQTMNPSTEDILNAVSKLDADNIFILPNNKNIILAAEQAAKIEKDKHILVIPAKTIPQGVTALISFCEGLPAEENAAAMTEALSGVKSGEVTYAVRDTSIDGKEIHAGNIMGIGDAGILAVGQTVEETTLELLQAMADDSSELLTVYFGADVTDDEGRALCEKLRKAFPQLEIEEQRGDQPVYYYIVSVE